MQFKDHSFSCPGKKRQKKLYGVKEQEETNQTQDKAMIKKRPKHDKIRNSELWKEETKKERQSQNTLKKKNRQ